MLKPKQVCLIKQDGSVHEIRATVAGDLVVTENDDVAIAAFDRFLVGEGEKEIALEVKSATHYSVKAGRFAKGPHWQCEVQSI